jgi:hypothetical protein
VAKVDADVEEHAPETGGICSVEEADAGRLASQEREAYLQYTSCPEATSVNLIASLFT